MNILKILMDIRDHYKLSYSSFFLFLLFYVSASFIVFFHTTSALSKPIEPDPLNISPYISEKWTVYGEDTQFLQTLRRRFHNVTNNWCNNLPYEQRLLCLEVLDRSTADALSWIDNIPHNQSIIGSLPRYIVGQAMQKMRSDCLNACYNDSVAQLLIYGSEIQYNYVIHILKGGGWPCLRSMLRASRRQLSQYRNLMSTCQSKAVQNNRCHPGLIETENLIVERILSLEKIAFSQYVSRYIHVQGRYPSINDREDFEQKNICSEYKIGEERILSVPFLSVKAFSISLFQLRSHYRVHRISDKIYRASIALDFSPALSYYNGPVPRNQVHEHYMKHIKDCVKKANRKLYGPDGQKLSIRIEDSQQISTCSPVHTIRIHNLIGYDGKSSFMSHDVNATCAHVVHELSHLFGLADAYDSKLTEFTPEALGNYISEAPIFDCRVKQPKSIMSYESERWKNVFTSSTEASLIDPVHFNAIIYGNCSRRNDVRLFRQCSALTFQGSLLNPGCLRQKAYCERQNLLGRDKNKELEDLSNLLQLRQSSFESFNKESSGQENTNQSSTGSSQGENKAYLEGLEREMKELERRIELVEQWPD